MSQDVVTVGRIKTLRPDGGVSLVAPNVPIQPERFKFTNDADLSAYLGQVVGGRSEDGGIRGSMSRTGTYTRRRPDGTEAVTFGDPVLDAISSADGTLVIGDRTIDLRTGQGSPGPSNGGGHVVPLDASTLKFTGMVNGAERWAADDNSSVEYRIGTGHLAFHAWKKDTIYLYWSMGGEISVYNTGVGFEAADVRAFSYISIPGHSPCAVYKDNYSPAQDGHYVDAYDWGWNSQQPERTAVLCRAQWYHAQFRDVLTAGSGCPNYLNENWPIGFPPEWKTITTIVELNGAWTDGSPRRAKVSVKRNAITIDMSDWGRPSAHGTVLDPSTITVTFPDDKTYTGNLSQPHTIRWPLNHSSWTKVVDTVMDLNGSWTDGSPRRAVIHEGDGPLTIDMSDFDRPDAHGSIVDASTITVTFPDDKTLTGNIQPPQTIRWPSNNSSWSRV
jgi:hypothetical protein